MGLQVINKSPKRILWPQWLGCIGATLVVMSTFLMFSWMSPYLDQLHSIDSSLLITEIEISRIGLYIEYGRLLGAVIGGICVAHCGSKTTLLLTATFPALGWICIISANSFSWLYMAQFLCGLALGSVFSFFPLYIGEISDPSIRGTFICLTISCMPLGNLMGSIMGSYIPLILFPFTALIPNIIAIMLLLWLPESPYHLVRTNKIEEAEKSVMWYHRCADPKADIERLRQFVNATASISLKDRLRELVLIILLFMLMGSSEMTSSIFCEMNSVTVTTMTGLNPDTVFILSLVPGTFSAWIATFLVDKCGRKTLLITSCLGAGTCMVSLGVLSMLLQTGYDSSHVKWLLIASTVILKMSIWFGLVPIPCTILGELFPSSIKSIAACIAGISAYIFSSITVRIYLPTTPYVYWLYAIAMVLSVIHVGLFLPETKGKSLQEIQSMLTPNDPKRAPRDVPWILGVPLENFSSKIHYPVKQTVTHR